MRKGCFVMGMFSNYCGRGHFRERRRCKPNSETIIKMAPAPISTGVNTVAFVKIGSMLNVTLTMSVPSQKYFEKRPAILELQSNLRSSAVNKLAPSAYLFFRTVRLHISGDSCVGIWATLIAVVGAPIVALRCHSTHMSDIRLGRNVKFRL